MMEFISPKCQYTDSTIDPFKVQTDYEVDGYICRAVTVDVKMKLPFGKIDVWAKPFVPFAVVIHLFDEWKPFEIPDTCSVVLCARKPDDTIVYYDRLPDGSIPWEIEGNRIIFKLDRQVTACPGMISAWIYVIDGTSRLGFKFYISIDEPGSTYSEIFSDDYINVCDSEKWEVL